MKNVAYHKFVTVKQERNDQSVVNMWNGMHLDTEAGRRVVEIYVTATHFDSILAWPKSNRSENREPRGNNSHWQVGNSNNIGRGRGDNHPVANVRAVRGGRGGQTGRGSYSAGGRTNSAMSTESWRKPQVDQEGNTRALGDMQDASVTPPTPSRGGLNIKTNAPPPNLDGTADSVSASSPRTGQIVTCFINKQGNYVPISSLPQISPLLQQNNPPNDTSPREQPVHGLNEKRSEYSLRDSTSQKTHLRVVPSMQNPHSQDELREGFHGDAPGGVRGGNHAANTQYLGGLQPVAPLGSTNGGDTADRKTQHANMPFGYSVPVLNYSASFANFIPPRMDAPGHKLHHTVSAANLVPSQPPSGPQAYYCNVPAFPSAPPRLFGSTNPSANDGSTSWFNKSQNAYLPATSEGTDPSIFKETFSISGAVNPRKMPAPLRVMDHTPTHVPASKLNLLQQNMQLWEEKTPTVMQKGFTYPQPVEGDGIPLHKRPSFFRLMAEKIHIENQLSGMTPGDDQVVFCGLHANKAELELQLDRLLEDDSSSNIHSDGSPCKHVMQGSSEIDSTVFGDFSEEGHLISPVRAKDGRILLSSSQANSVQCPRPDVPPSWPSHMVNRARNTPYTESYGFRAEANVNAIVGTPPTSVQVDQGTSPTPRAAKTGTDSVASLETNPFSEPQSEGDGSGGIRLEG